MKILFLDQFSDPGGAQQVLLELLPAVRAGRWDALVALPGSGPLFDSVRALGFPSHRIDCGPYHSGRKSLADLGRFVADTPRLARQIRTLAQEHRADLVYANGPRVVPAAARADTGLPLVFHAHSYLGPGPIRTLVGRSLRRARAFVIGSCRFASDPWSRYVDPGRLSIIYNGVAGPPSPPIPRTPHTPPSIGCIGRIAPEKGQLEFLEAASIIHRKLPDSRFSIYGSALFSDPAARQYEARVRTAAAGLPVDFAGWVPDVYTALADLDLLLVPSAAHEATTRVILEAFAAGVPVIAFHSGGIPEIIDHGVTGLLAGSPEAMAGMSLDLLTGDPARPANIATAARHSWESRFTLEHHHRQLLDTLTSIA